MNGNCHVWKTKQVETETNGKLKRAGYGMGKNFNWYELKEGKLEQMGNGKKKTWNNQKMKRMITETSGNFQ